MFDHDLLERLSCAHPIVPLALYGPESDFTYSGNGEVFGSVVARTIKGTGSGFYHYDEALGDLAGWGLAKMAHLYWREPSLPPR